MRFSIHAVTAETVGVLLELIRELACFEKLEHEVVGTEATLRESLCGPQAAAGALLAYEGGVPAGYAIYFFTFSSFVGRRGIWLDDVYVRPAFRQQGLGRMLIQAVARIGAARNCGRFEWMALNWNQHALDFYRRIGAKTMDEWVLLRLDKDGMHRLAAAEPTANPNREKVEAKPLSAEARNLEH